MSTVQLFSQVASLIDRNIVKAVARECGSDKYAKTIDTWTHLVSMVFCQLADCQSLRDIELGMKGIRRELGHLGIRKAPSRNALSRQNRRRNPWVAREVYRRLREKLLGQQPYRCAFRKGIDVSPVNVKVTSAISVSGISIVQRGCPHRAPPPRNRSAMRWQARPTPMRRACIAGPSSTASR